MAVMLWSASIVNCADRQNPSADPFPSMLRGLRIGMSEQELLAARPEAEKFEILEERESEKNDPNPLYMEGFSGSPFFDTAMYSFCERKLCLVTLSAVGRGDGFAGRQAKVLQGALRKWGPNPEHLLSLREAALDPAAQMSLEHSQVEPRKRGVLLWTVGRLRVLAVFAPQEARQAGRRGRLGEIGVTITDPQLLSKEQRQIFFESLAPVRSASDAELFDLLNRQAEPPLFE